MGKQSLLEKIESNFEAVLDRQSSEGQKLLNELLALHHADIALFLSNLDHERFALLFKRFDVVQQLEIFQHLSPSLKAQALARVDDEQKIVFLEHMSMDEMSDLEDFVSDDELKKYFALLRTSHREKVISLLQLAPNTVGTVMDINVVSLHENLTVARSIQILQRLRPEQELHKTIYITDTNNKLVGNIGLEDLVLKSPTAILASFMKPNELVVSIEEDQEVVSQKMRHYQMTSVPVVGTNDYFLGAVTESTLVEILEEEASEDILRISAAGHIKHTYFETPFARMLMGRGAILLVLMIVESFAAFIINSYEQLLTGLGLGLFITMLTSTGGNTSTQASAFVVQGLASGDLTSSNVRRFLTREFLMALCLAVVLGAGAFLRVFYIGHQSPVVSLAVAVSVALVVLVAVSLGSVLPFILKKIGLDPAFAAAPFLATGMDLLGLLMYCTISYYVINCAFLVKVGATFAGALTTIGHCVGLG